MRPDHQRVGDVGLVDHDEFGDLAGTDLGQHLADSGDLPLGEVVGAVDHVQDQVGVGDLLQGRAEGLDQLVGQVTHEPDGVGEREEATGRRAGLAHGGVQGREQRVLDEDPGTGHAVEQARLAGVGVAGQHDRGDLAPPARAAHGVPRRGHRGDLATQPRDALPDAAPVGLDLGLAGATGADALTAGHAPTSLPGQRLAPTAQAWQEVLHLGQGDLRLALTAAGVLGEDVEDQPRAVHHLDLHELLEPAQLPGGELAVADDRVRPHEGDHLAQLRDLARADVGGGVGLVPSLDQAVAHLGPGGLGQSGKLGQGALGLLQRA